MRCGPTLTASLWDPADPAGLAARVETAAGRTSLPVTAVVGDVAGLRQLTVWAGSLGLGLPEDDAGAWAALGIELGRLVLAVRPLLALTADEWAADELLDPDLGVLAPGLACGWVRTGGLDGVRSERFALLAERGVVRGLGDGLTWAASGTVSLDGRTAGADGEVAEQVFRAWTGESGAEAATSTRLVLGLRPATTEDDVRSALPEGYEVLGVAEGVAVARPPVWAGDVEADLAEASALLDALWGWVEAAVLPGRGVRARVAPVAVERRRQDASRP